MVADGRPCAARSSWITVACRIQYRRKNSSPSAHDCLQLKTLFRRLATDSCNLFISRPGTYVLIPQWKVNPSIRSYTGILSAELPAKGFMLNE